MAREQRGRVAIAIILIAVGLYLFSIQFFPTLQVFAINESNWPLLIVGLGALFLLAALLTWTPGLMVPAAVLGGLGALFFWQIATTNWDSWSYAWALIPGFVGVGILLMHLMQGNGRKALRRGGPLILASLVAFVLLSSFIGVWDILIQYWPLLLILGGVILLGRTFWRRA